MYRITYEQGNGYRCGCCRRTWTDQEDLQTEEEVRQWLINLAVDQKHPIWEDSDDREVISIEKEIGVDILDTFVIPQEELEAKIAERKSFLENKKAKEDEARRAKKEEREKKQLKELAAKYPELVKEA
jgi:hypothetical protein